MDRVDFSRKEFKIAKIVDEYSVVINGGGNSGIKEGDQFEIYDPGELVKDPDTGIDLGALEYVKATVIAVRVYPRMALCKNEDSISLLMRGIAENFAARPAELNVDAESISGGLDEKIRVGDLVRKLAKPNIKEKSADTVKTLHSPPED